jgi:hypothetical protein
MIKTYITIAICVLSFGGGMLTHAKLFKQEVKIPPCPDCNCPPNVSIQQLDMSTIRKIKGDFTYSPKYDGTVIMNNCQDSTKTN